MNRRDFVKAVGWTATVSCLTGCHTLGAAAPRRKKQPNIILIMADDMGFSDIGCYGGEIRTPNLDRLAAEGVRFTHFYNAARCCPTRASLLTGLYPHQAGMGGMVNGRGPGPYQGYLNDRCVTLAEVLKTAGYTTLMSGKWHVGEDRPHWPTDRGFERFFGLVSGGANYWNIAKAKAPNVRRKMAMDDQPFTPPREGFYMTDAFTDHAVQFLENDTTPDKPFFLYLAYTAPHWPLHAWPEDIARYRGTYRIGWDELRRRRHRRQLDMGLVDAQWPLTPRDEAVQPWDSLDDARKEEMDLKMAVYAAQIDRMDQGIGRVLEAVRRLGREEETMVLFLSDNGGCHEGGPWGFDNRKNGLPPGGEDSYMSYGQSWANASNTPFRLYKHWVHEGGISTPLIARWPGVIRPGTLCHEVGHIIDFMPTCCEVSGADYPDAFKDKPVTPLEGKSLVPCFQGRPRIGHEALYWEHEGNKAIRQDDWKLVSRKGGRWELYNMAADRTELHDRAEQDPQRVQDMLALYRAWAQRCGVRD